MWTVLINSISFELQGQNIHLLPQEKRILQNRDIPNWWCVSMFTLNILQAGNRSKIWKGKIFDWSGLAFNVTFVQNFRIWFSVYQEMFTLSHREDGSSLVNFVINTIVYFAKLVYMVTQWFKLNSAMVYASTTLDTCNNL